MRPIERVQERFSEARRSGSVTLQTEFDFVAELPEQSTRIADYPVPDCAVREMISLAERKGRKAADAIADILLRECGSTLGAAARRLIAARFLTDRADRQRAFLEGLGLRCNAGSLDRYGPGSWTLTQERRPSGPLFVISGIRSPAGGFVCARLEAKAFYRAASALKAIVRAIGPGDYAKPPASEWRRIWDGDRQRAAGLMAALLVGGRS
jgi:hypothetical protein